MKAKDKDKLYSIANKSLINHSNTIVSHMVNNNWEKARAEVALLEESAKKLRKELDKVLI